MRHPSRANSALRCPPEPSPLPSGFGATRSAVTALLIASMLAGLPTPCHAAPETDEDRIERIPVAYEATDLTDPVRARKLLWRLDSASMQACGAMDGMSLPMRKAVERSACHRTSLTASVSSLHSPILSQLAQDMIGTRGVAQEAP
ncbi:UrcA family protein [Asaia sp. VD9]|uniref:UrcA family protein n=1 Tax=Asaia sp. VD9 TaxID=3081235 RepID=UPI0030178E91